MDYFRKLYRIKIYNKIILFFEIGFNKYWYGYLIGNCG